MYPLEISPEQLRNLLDKVAQFAVTYLEKLDSQKIVPEISGNEAQQIFQSEWPKQALKADALAQLFSVMQNSRAQNDRFFGYVLGSGEPVAALADLLASVLNQNVTAWRSAPAAVALERKLIDALAAALGCRGYHGSFCGGGSMANLMALTMAREAHSPANVDGARPGVVYASSEVHMSIPKAMAVLGLGRKRLRLIPTDACWRMSLPHLRE